MCANLTPLSHSALRSNKYQLIADYKGKIIDGNQFFSDVKALSARLSRQNTDQFALYYEQAYPFCVSLFALLHSSKKIWIAGNNKQIAAEQLIEKGCVLLGDWDGRELSIIPDINNSVELKPIDSNDTQITIFTSGSSGKAKAIDKSLQQFQREIEVLEQYWGGRLGNSQVLGTVSHQHIYGLLFRVLWPLSAGRCFHSEMFLSPEPLLIKAKNLSAYWVSSPAQLKRLDALTPWNDLVKLTAIFSSGGALSVKTAENIAQQCQQKVLEIYGSSETGGIAWRQSANNKLWQVFNGIRISVDEKGFSHLSSPYLEQKTVILDDIIKIIDEGQFLLLGRVDRIVKVEEKRLSLDSLESRLNCSNYVQQSHAILLDGKREIIAMTLVLTDLGKETLNQRGRGTLVKQLRKELMREFETVVLPRKWLFFSSLPLTVQGKIDQDCLIQLFSLKHTHSPQIISCDYQDERVELYLQILPGLVYFNGHFPDQPILPGVTQLAWVEQFGKIFFDIGLPFLRMEVIKFKKVIRPDELIKMELNWKAETGKLYFEFTSMNNDHSSCRIVYGEQ
ncbi:MAG: AMP-binding protein [Methylococcaceae bacterium]|nr:AMP-binding protein [Methylococcaceae bacterium]